MDTTFNAGARPAAVFPSMTVSTLLTLILAGCAATIAFDFYGQSISPLLGFATLAPIGLAQGVLNTLFDAGSRPAAYLLHFLAGLIFYPAGWLLVVEPLRRAFLPKVHWAPVAVVYGILLWVFALYILAHLVVGMAPFLGFSGITWVAFVGHILFAVVAAAVVDWRDRGTA